MHELQGIKLDRLWHDGFERRSKDFWLAPIDLWIRLLLASLITGFESRGHHLYFGFAYLIDTIFVITV